LPENPTNPKDGFDWLGEEQNGNVAPREAWYIHPLPEYRFGCQHLEHCRRHLIIIPELSKKGSGSMQFFRAGAQYGDCKGTASADENAPSDAFKELFETAGKIDPEKEILIAFEFFYIESNVYITGIFS
jgi:hypothetical protein